jgi:hypothetical protein
VGGIGWVFRGRRVYISAVDGDQLVQIGQRARPAESLFEPAAQVRQKVVPVFMVIAKDHQSRAYTGNGLVQVAECACPLILHQLCFREIGQVGESGRIVGWCHHHSLLKRSYGVSQVRQVVGLFKPGPVRAAEVGQVLRAVILVVSVLGHRALKYRYRGVQVRRPLWPFGASEKRVCQICQMLMSPPVADRRVGHGHLVMLNRLVQVGVALSVLITSLQRVAKVAMAHGAARRICLRNVH